MPMRRIPLFALALLALSTASGQEGDLVSFRGEIKALLREKCLHCHNRKTLPDRVSLESRRLAFTKTPAGQPIIVPGKPDESLLVVALESPVFHEKAMPMVGPRPDAREISRIRRWIAEGAEWPGGPAGRIRPYFHAKE